MKDGPEGDEIISQLKVVEVGTDDDCDTITNCVIEDPSPAPASAPQKRSTPIKMSPKNRIVLAALDCALAAQGEPAPPHLLNHIPPNTTVVKADLWQSFYLAGTASDGQNKETRKRAFRRVRDFLYGNEFLEIYNEMVWKADRTGYH